MPRAPRIGEADIEQVRRQPELRRNPSMIEERIMVHSRIGHEKQRPMITRPAQSTPLAAALQALDNIAVPIAFQYPRQRAIAGRHDRAK